MDTQSKKQIKKLIIKTLIVSIVCTVLIILSSNMGKIWFIISSVVFLFAIGWTIFEAKKITNEFFQKVEEQKTERINKAKAKLNPEFQDVILCKDKQEKIEDALGIPAREIKCQAKVNSDGIIYKVYLNYEGCMISYEEFADYFE